MTIWQLSWQAIPLKRIIVCNSSSPVIGLPFLALDAAQEDAGHGLSIKSARIDGKRFSWE